MATSNQIALALLFWLDPLLRRGARQPLMEGDVWKLGPDDTAASLHKRFMHHWRKEAALSKPRMFRSVLRTLQKETLIGVSLAVVYAVLLLLQPTVIKSLLEFLQDSDVAPIFGISSGYGLAGLLAGLSFVSVTIFDSSFYVMATVATNAKSIAMDIVFVKALQLSSSVQRSMTSGEIVTMLSVDSQRIFTGFPYLPWVVMPIISLPLIFVLIGRNMGWLVGLVGGLSLLVLMVICCCIAQTAGKLQRQLLAIQAERVKLTNEILQGIRVIKMYGWEAFLQEHVAAIRNQELAVQRRYILSSQLGSIGLIVAPTFALAVCLVVYVAQGNTLTPPIAFTALAYLNIARLPCNLFYFGVMNFAEAIASADRIGAFLLADEVESIATKAPNTAQPVISIVDGAFDWTAHQKQQSPEKTRCFLQDINTSIPPCKITMVVGPVGSGKTSLISAMLGEIHQVDGKRTVQGRVAYVSQEAWIQHANVRDNILFSEPLDHNYYDLVISACQLKPDLAILPHGDATEIGERGINLSGGQKARVSLARAMYRRDADIFLLDDPLSALDVHVAGAVFREGIQGLLRGKTVVLVLNSHYHLLHFADNILVMDQGRIVGQGTVDSLQETFPHLKQGTRLQPQASSVVEADDSAVIDKGDVKVEPRKTKGGLVEREERHLGLVTRRTYVAYFAASGWHGPTIILCLSLTYVVSQTTSVMADWFMGRWARGKDGLSTTTSAAIYVGLVLGSVLLIFGRSLLALVTNLACVKTLHENVLDKVVRAPVTTFFDVTPVGRILNRFSSDLSEIETRLPNSGLYLLQHSFQVAGIMVVCAATSPYMLVLYVPLLFLFHKIQVYFGRSSAELKRMASISRTPVVNSIAEIINGLSTIRAFGMTANFQQKARSAVDHAQSFAMIQFMSSRWLQMRLDWLSAIVVTGVAFLCVASKASIGVTAAGLALTYASQLSGFLSRVVMYQTEVGDQMTSVERLLHYNSLDMEGQTSVATNAVPTEWPSQGSVVFENYSMRYREGLDLVLKDVNFSVEAGEKIGICGRTGSGKSSLMVALFRTVEAAAGCIRIDGVDIGTIDLKSLRSRLTIIPQDPVLFSGSLRFNLDPSDMATDDDVWRVLKEVHLKEVIQSQGGLDFQVAEKGGNLSVGQRQLVCIARALLRHSRVVVLDEATANIDLESDRLIQATIKSSFAGVTLLVIAHRLDTILDSDRILVMDKGRVCEFDTPTNLLALKDGAFASLLSHSHNLR
ncbi:unnamed protein product [Aphanomyces euteiches]